MLYLLPVIMSILPCSVSAMSDLRDLRIAQRFDKIADVERFHTKLDVVLKYSVFFFAFLHIPFYSGIPKYTT